MKNILLFFSAFIPMYALIIIKTFIELCMGNIKLNLLNIIVLIFLFVLIILGLVGLKLEIRNKAQKSVEVIILSAKNITDQHFLGYFSLFVLFAITFDLSRMSMFIVFIIIISMIGVVYVKNKLFFINPFLNILGYNFYDISYKHINDEKIYHTRIFFKGKLLTNIRYFVKIKDKNFSFVDHTLMNKFNKKDS